MAYGEYNGHVANDEVTCTRKRGFASFCVT